MIRTTNRLLNVPAAAPAALERGETLSLHHLWTMLARNRWLALGVLAAALLLAALLTWKAAPQYETTATLQIEDQDSGNLLKDISPFRGLDRGTVETDMVVLGSRRLAEEVADSLTMQLVLMEPRGTPRSRVFSQARGTERQGSGTFELEPGPGGSWSLTSKDARGFGALPGTVRAGTPFRLGGLTLVLRPQHGDAADKPIRFAVRRWRGTVASLTAAVGVSRPNRDAKVISLRYRSTDPELTAAVPNALMTAFIAYKNGWSKSDAHSTVDFLRDQVARYEGQLREAEASLRGFRETERVVEPQAEATEDVKRLAALQAEREGHVTERDALARLLARTSQSNNPEERAANFRQLASFPTFLSNKAVQDILQTLTQLQSERLLLLQRRQESNADVQGYNERIEALQDQLFQTAKGYAQSLDSRIASLDANLGRFNAQMAAVPAREVTYARLLRQQKLLEDIYTLLQTRLKENEIQLAVKPTDVRVIDEAVVPERPVSPNPLLNAFLALVLGTLFAGTAVFLREALNTRIRNKDDVQHATNGLPVLGTIPRIQRSSAAPVNGNGNGKNGNGRGGAHVVPVPAERMLEERLVMRRAPRSPVAEAYRALRTNLTFATSEAGPRTVVVTSAAPGDGKSTSAANLAITLALQGGRVLLVDADLRRGVLHRIFNVPQEPGLSQVLHLGVEMARAVSSVSVGEEGETVDVLPTGILPPNPAELLGSPAMRRFLDEARGRYDTVIFDAPPVNAVTDAAVLGTLVDLTLLVARAGVTDRRALEHAISQLRNLGVAVAGTVLNDVDRSESGYYAYSYGGNGKE